MSDVNKKSENNAPGQETPKDSPQGSTAVGVAKQNRRDMFGGGIRLIFIGLAIFAIVYFGLYPQLALAYPYITPTMLIGLQIYSVICFFTPGLIFIVLKKHGTNIAPGSRHLIPSGVRTLLIIAGVLACVGILGIRTGVSIILNLTGTAEKPEEAKQNLPVKAISAYRLYMRAGGLYLLSFGLVFLALIEFMLVITIDLAYPTLTQPLILGIEIWIWVCMMAPSIILLICSFWIKPGQAAAQRALQQKIFLPTAIIAILSIFGFSVGINLIRSRWMVNSEPGAATAAEK